MARGRAVAAAQLGGFAFTREAFHASSRFVLVAAQVGRFAFATVDKWRASRAGERGRQCRLWLPCWVCRAGVCGNAALTPCGAVGSALPVGAHLRCARRDAVPSPCKGLCPLTLGGCRPPPAGLCPDPPGNDPRRSLKVYPQSSRFARTAQEVSWALFVSFCSAKCLKNPISLRVGSSMLILLRRSRH